tara:strand:- start:83 stop:934 length:852 start_codon:yes stop_codon:yes gene_type:complete
MPGRLNVADLQGKSPDFKIELEHDTVLEVHGDLRLNNQSYAPIPGGPDNEKPNNPEYGSLWMNTWTGQLEYWKGPGKGGWDYINPGSAGANTESGQEEAPQPVITNLSEWNSMAQADIPHLVQTSAGGQEMITPQQQTTQQGSKIVLPLGSLGSINGTSFPGNSANQTWNRTLSTSFVETFQKFGYIFSGQRLAITGVTGQSESCCDPYRYESMFGSTYTGQWAEIRGSAQSNSSHNPYEIQMNSFSSSASASSNLILRYSTDGSVNGGQGFYTHTPSGYLYA